MNKNILVIIFFSVIVFSIKHIFCSKIEITKANSSNATKTLSPNEYSLYKAAYLGREGKIKRLIENGTNVNVKSPNSKRTPLHIAVSKGRIEIAKVLCNAGADINAKTDKGETPLALAIEVKKPDLIDYLKSKGAKVTQEMLNKASSSIKAILEK